MSCDDLQILSQEILDEAVANGEENSLQFCVYKDNECVVDVYAGYIDYEQTRKVNGDTIFPIYSSSKGVPATALTRLIAQGVVTPETLVGDIWPEFAQNGKETCRLIHILNHTSGLPQRLKSQKTYADVANWATMIEDIEKVACDWVAGAQARYQSLTYGWVTAEIIERLTNKSFKEYVQAELFEPENIDNFYFGTDDNAEKNAAEIKLNGMDKVQSFSICDPLDDLMREPIIRQAVLPGFNGIASAHALAKFYNAVLQGRYFSDEVLNRATAYNSATPSKNSFTTFGWGYALSGGVDNVGNVFGHGGYGGADGLAERTKGLAVGFTTGNLGAHPCKDKLFELVNLVQREGWLD